MAGTQLHPVAEALDLPGRDLELDELVAVAETLAAREDLWRPLAAHDPRERTYESLFVDDHVGVWVISWMPGHDTGFHDHDGARGAVVVVEGEIREERPVWGKPPQRIDARVGDSFSFGETELHRMVDATADPCTTIHVYSPPLQAMGMYRIEDDGSVRRHSVDWDQHLDA
jgi:predicted metal-dependent enzyme (double-stranded beta helix superfamily)